MLLVIHLKETSGLWPIHLKENIYYYDWCVFNQKTTRRPHVCCATSSPPPSSIFCASSIVWPGNSWRLLEYVNVVPGFSFSQNLIHHDLCNLLITGPDSGPRLNPANTFFADAVKRIVRRGSFKSHILPYQFQSSQSGFKFAAFNFRMMGNGISPCFFSRNFTNRSCRRACFLSKQIRSFHILLYFSAFARASSKLSDLVKHNRLVCGMLQLTQCQRQCTLSLCTCSYVSPNEPWRNCRRFLQHVLITVNEYNNVGW